MADLKYIYSDAALTTPVDDTTGLAASAITGNSTDGVFYVGVADTAAKLQAQSDPGIDQITVDIVDSNIVSGAADTEIKLALSSAGLDSAVAGATLSIGATINGGQANAVAVHWRWTNAAGSGDYTDLSLDLPAIVESAV